MLERRIMDNTVETDAAFVNRVMDFLDDHLCAEVNLQLDANEYVLLREDELSSVMQFIPISDLQAVQKNGGWNALCRQLLGSLRKSGMVPVKTTEYYKGLLHEEERPLFERLRRKRNDLAKEAGISAYMVLSNRSLYEMCMHRPSNKEELTALYGIGEHSAERYGDAFLQVINSNHSHSDAEN
jgi:superfamily II DNA helicase RecQ